MRCYFCWTFWTIVISHIDNDTLSSTPCANITNSLSTFLPFLTFWFIYCGSSNVDVCHSAGFWRNKLLSSCKQRYEFSVKIFLQKYFCDFSYKRNNCEYIIEIRAIEFMEYVIVIYISHRNVDRKEYVEKQRN